MKPWGMEKKFAFGKPCVQGCVPLKLPKRESGAEMDMEMDHVFVVSGSMLVGRNTDSINIL